VSDVHSRGEEVTLKRKLVIPRHERRCRNALNEISLLLGGCLSLMAHSERSLRRRTAHRNYHNKFADTPGRSLIEVHP
jgi:hypothetical protein